MEITSSIASPIVIHVLLSQTFAAANVENGDTKEDDGCEDEYDVKHEWSVLLVFLSNQNFTRIDKLILFSIFFKSGVHRPMEPQPPAGARLPSRHAKAPGAPKVLPAGGVTPPGPDQ